VITLVGVCGESSDCFCTKRRQNQKANPAAYRDQPLGRKIEDAIGKQQLWSQSRMDRID
jgi:hypothetical protein